MQRIIAIYILFFVSFSLAAQEKREFERKIKPSAVPGKAIDWVNNTYGLKRGITWYEEISSGKQSFEAKFKYMGKRHSVEFDNSGNLEDIEIRKKINELPEEVQSNIYAYLNATYQKHRFTKIQEQWSGDEKDMADAINSGDPASVTIRYEIEFYGKNEMEDALWEGLFDETGELIGRSKIILRPTDNLLY